ncbi:hypothetical protein [Vibrio viridaestus]|uniref:Uncharacterized protein n=1 Tax=Vibrio viridaestus TaxID=2487322 RepID=A0A3N9TMZ1_9VIBR|nr:hypothetical protein [Vibrio viridaestus]RQW65015.1 hypothetical protein EES38_03000 [Vibrio viridaestus]
MDQSVRQNMSPSSSFAAILENNRSELARIDEISKTPITAKKRNIVFTALVFALVLLLGLFAIQIITGIVALILLVITAVGLFFGLRFLKAMDPYIRQKTQNILITKMTQEARKNAVSQLDAQVIKNTERLELARAARNKMGAAIESLRGQINEKNVGKPHYERKKEILSRVQVAYEQVQIKLDSAAKANQAFAIKVREYKEMEAFAAQASEAMKFFKSTGDSQLEDMLSLEAFNQIESDFNTALIDIENSVHDISMDVD